MIAESEAERHTQQKKSKAELDLVQAQVSSKNSSASLIIVPDNYANQFKYLSS